MRARTWICAVLVAQAAGCLDRDLEPLAPCTVSNLVAKLRVNRVEKVDVLFMVDNSNSMTEEQMSLAVQLPHVARVLATGDRNEDGVEDFPPVRDLHLGVVTSDMGNLGFPVPTCTTTFGDDGILVTRGNTALTGCMATYAPYLAFTPPGDAVRFGNDFACVARVGTGGCGFEQQLESVLKALTPSTSPITFAMGTTGHADRENAGFVRSDSVLAAILLTDEEDCSVLDADLVNPSSTTYTGDLNLRCFQYPSAVHPISRFVDGFRALRPDPDLFVFAAITGVPTDLVSDPTHLDYDAVLADERMQEVVDTGGTRLRPSCDVPGRGLAFPPRRLVTLARELGHNSMVQSICQEDYGPALDAIIGKLADVLNRVCLDRALNPDATGRVPCDVVEVMPAGGDVTRCEQLAGRTFMRMSDPGRGEPAGREVCRVDQAPHGEGTGWYYDDGAAAVAACPAIAPQRIAFTTGAEPPTGTDVHLECLPPVQSTQSIAEIGLPCRDDASVCTRGRSALVCETATGTCQLPCASDSDCSTAGLGGFVCDTRPTSGLSTPVCVNATCGR